MPGRADLLYGIYTLYGIGVRSGELELAKSRSQKCGRSEVYMLCPSPLLKDQWKPLVCFVCSLCKKCHKFSETSLHAKFNLRIFKYSKCPKGKGAPATILVLHNIVNFKRSSLPPPNRYHLQEVYFFPAAFQANTYLKS